ncbi:hypothetical protein JMUB5695_02232 [Mycobacterium heckeshornense]|nr:hypothetical protein JMUB5695_02232 [Mycobacterium heckeshornense]
MAAGIPAVTFWAAVPHYVSQPPNPKATVALLRRVEDVLDIEVPLADLPAQAEEWEAAVTEMTAEDEEIAEYVASFEQPGDGAGRNGPQGGVWQQRLTAAPVPACEHWSNDQAQRLRRPCAAADRARTAGPGPRPAGWTAPAAASGPAQPSPDC